MIFGNENKDIYFSYTQEIDRFLSSLNEDYPNFNEWFQSKVVQGLHNDTRKTFVKFDDGKILGIGIAKKTPSENKICTIRIDENFQDKGIGTSLMQAMLEWLDVKYPVITVPESKILILNPILQRFDFKKTSLKNGVYLPNRKEFFFNEADAKNNPSHLVSHSSKTLAVGN